MRVISFDIFDTCLVRTVAGPGEVFRLLARHLAGQDEFPGNFEDQFPEWRVTAEQQCRLTSPREDISLTAIWDELARATPALATWRQRGPALELEVEASVLAPVSGVLARVVAARRNGARIVFISDMYLPADFLRECLRRHGFWQEGDGLYVSGDHGLTKRSGALFRLVLERECITAAQLLHYGDDPVSDLAAPGRLGIATAPLPLASPSAVENALLRHRHRARPSCVEIVAGLRLRRHEPPPPPDPAGAAVEALLGPVLCLFSHWLLSRARADRVRWLGFVSRDARLVWTVARQIAARSYPEIECRYLLTSRQALYLPAVRELTPGDLPWLAAIAPPPTVATALARLELTEDEIQAVWPPGSPRPSLSARLDAPEIRTAFWTALTDPALAPIVLARAGTRRTAALCHLESLGLPTGEEAAIVDLGSLLYCQEALNKICMESRGPGSIRGYYLFLKSGHRLPHQSGPATALCYEPPDLLPRSADLDWIDRTDLLEHVLGLADHPSVTAYTDAGQVSYAATPPSIAPEDFALLERALLAYVESYHAIWESAVRHGEAAPVLSIVLAGALSQPEAAMLGLFERITYPIDEAHRQLNRIIRPYGWPELLRSCLPGGRQPERAGQPRLWPEASLAATPRIRRTMWRLLRTLRRL